MRVEKIGKDAMADSLSLCAPLLPVYLLPARYYYLQTATELALLKIHSHKKAALLATLSPESPQKCAGKHCHYHRVRFGRMENANSPESAAVGIAIHWELIEGVTRKPPKGQDGGLTHQWAREENGETSTYVPCDGLRGPGNLKCPKNKHLLVTAFWTTAVNTWGLEKKAGMTEQARKIHTNMLLHEKIEKTKQNSTNV